MKKLTAILAALMTAACMTAGTAMAADFTPSVTGKAAPEPSRSRPKAARKRLPLSAMPTEPKSRGSPLTVSR